MNRQRQYLWRRRHSADAMCKGSAPGQGRRLDHRIAHDPKDNNADNRLMVPASDIDNPPPGCFNLNGTIELSIISLSSNTTTLFFAAMWRNTSNTHVGLSTSTILLDSAKVRENDTMVVGELTFEDKVYPGLIDLKKHFHGEC